MLHSPNRRLYLRTTVRERYKKSRLLCTWTKDGVRAWRLLSLYVPRSPSAWQELLQKSSLPPGARWITVHPNGKDEPGVPVVIKESEGDPGSYYIVGGAGGKLNHMKLTGVKSADAYKAEQEERAKTKREEKKAEKKKMAEAGTLDAHSEMEEALKTAGTQKRAAWLRDKVLKMLPLLGQNPDDYVFNEKHLDKGGLEAGSAAAKMVEYHYYKGLSSKLDERVNVLKRRMLEDEGSREAAGVSGFSLTPGDTAPIDAAVEGANAADSRLVDIAFKLDQAEKRGDTGAKAALEGEQAKAEEERDQFNAVLEDMGAPTIDELSGATVGTGKGYNALAKERGVATLEEAGDLSAEALRSQADDSRGKEVIRSVQGMGIADSTLDLVQEAMDKRKQLLGEAAEAAEKGDKKGAFTKWKKAEALVTKWGLRVEKAQQYTGEMSEGEYLDMLGVKVKEGQETMAAVSRACSKGSTAAPEDLVKAQATYANLRKLVAVQKEFTSKEQHLEGAQKEVEKSAAGSGYKVDMASIADKFDVDSLSDDEALAKADKDLDTARMAHWNAALLSEVESSGELTSQLAIDTNKLQKAMAQHIGVGSFAAFSNASILGAGDVLLDRAAIDLFGPKLSASLLAAHLKGTLDPKQYQALTEGLEAFHADTSTDTAKDAYERAQDSYKEARAIGFGALGDPSDPIAMQYLNDQRRNVLETTLKDLGVTIGGLRANAEMVSALKRGHPKGEALGMPLEADTQVDSMIQNLAALGLSRSDYEIRIDPESKQRNLFLSDSAVPKLVKSDLSQEDINSAATGQAIKSGEHDEAGWLPDGVARRAATSFEGDNPEPVKFAIEPNFMDKSGADMEDHVADFIGSRVADGWPVDTVLSDMRSGSFQGTHLSTPGTEGDMFSEGTPGKSVVADVEAAIRKHLPTLAITSKLDPSSVAKFNADKEAQAQKLAEGFRAKNGLSADSLHTQGIDQDDPGTHEALHRALAANPASVVAFKGQQELDAKDKGALRSYFWKAMSGEKQDESQAAKKTDQEKRDRAKPGEPGKAPPDTGGQALSMFGDEDTKVNDPVLAAQYGPDDTIDVDIGGGKKRTVNALAYQSERREAMFGRTTDMTGQETGKYGDMQAGDQEFAARNAWERYMMAHGDNPDAAYRSIQEHMRGGFNEAFTKHYQKLTGKPLRMSKIGMTTGKAHAVGLLPPEEFSAKYKDMQEPLKSEMSDVGRGGGGKYTRGARKEKAQKNVEAREGAQGQLLQAEETESQAPMRTSLGDRAESQIGSMVNQARDRWNPKADPVGLFSVSMGDNDPKNQKFYKQQRAIKLIGHQKKVGLWLGAGSGKTLTTIGAYAHLNASGQARRALFAVPSVVQKQFGAEGLRYLDPATKRADGRKGYKWHAEAGASQAERYKAYQDGSTDFMVLTHQAIARDTLSAIASHRKLKDHGGEDSDDAPWEQSEAAAYLNGLSREERAKVVKEAHEHMGWHGFDMLYVDEAHYIANRQGKKNSTMANVMDAVGDNLKYHVLGSGTPIKNDASEAFDMLSKLDKGRFSDRADFMRKYGGNTAASKEALQRLSARYFYQDKVESGVQAKSIIGDNGKPISLTPEQREAYDGVQKAYTRLKIEREDAKSAGRPIDEKILVDSMKILSPNSFKGLSEDQHVAKATDLLPAAGTVKDAAYNRVINGGKFETNAKMQHIAKLAAQYKKAGKPGVVFARNLETVAELKRGLSAAGHRVATITGAMSGQEKDAARLAFSPDSKKDADATADILILSDAGNTGLNLQRGKWLAHIDQPYTAPTKEQRDARINRLGQTEDVDIHELVTDTPFDGKAQRRLARKAVTSHIFQDASHSLDDTGLAAHVNAAYRRISGHGRMAAKAVGTNAEGNTSAKAKPKRKGERDSPAEPGSAGAAVR